MTHSRKLQLLFWIPPVLLMIWWRAHTFAPTVAEVTGLNLWPSIQGRSEPLDCDEAAYGYMGRRQTQGAVLYKDLTEYKPPGGYWFYAVSIGISGANEMTVRLMVIPVLIANLILVGWILKQVCSRITVILGMFCFILLSTDPYVYGNGSNLEHLMNLGLTAAIASLIYAKRSNNEFQYIFVSGICVGLACLVKQVCFLGFLPIAVQILLSRSSVRQCLNQYVFLVLGFISPILIAIFVLMIQGSLSDAWADVIQYSRSLAALTPPDANAPPWYFRWLTGNADPRNGRLPWPFGRTDWLVWWGAGSWPLLLISLVCVVSIGLHKSNNATSDVSQLVSGYWVASWLMIMLPGLYWQHYYLLLVPSCSILVSLLASGLLKQLAGSQSDIHKISGLVGLLLLLFGVGLTASIQIKDYLFVPSEQITVKYKGGAQWVTLRLLSEEIEKRVSDWSPQPKMEVWGWQSPLLFYSGLDAPSKYFFTDPLMKAYSNKGLPFLKPRLEGLTRDLNETKPELIFCGDQPYAELKLLIDRDYIASSLVASSPQGQGLYVRKDKYAAFHSVR